MDGDTTAGVLICDDNDAMRALLEAIVESAPGMRVVGQAADGNEAIVEAIRVHPDVILLDLAMPKLSGFDALPELRRVVPDAQIVVFSGFAGSSVGQQIIALGAAAYLEKGAADPDLIVATIERALASTRRVSVSVTRA